MAERCHKRVNLKLFCGGKEFICVESRAVGSPGKPWSYNSIGNYILWSVMRRSRVQFSHFRVQLYPNCTRKHLILEEWWPRSIFAREHYSAKIIVSQTFLSDTTQVFWLNKILRKTCFHGYWACSVSMSKIMKFE